MCGEGQLATTARSEPPWALSVSGAAPVAVAAPSAPVSVSGAGSSIPRAGPVAAVEVEKGCNCITTAQRHGRQVEGGRYSPTLSSGGHRALSSVHERLASGAWSYRSLHEYTLCRRRTKHEVRRTESSQLVNHSVDVPFNVGCWPIYGWGAFTDTHSYTPGPWEFAPKDFRGNM